jgi:hypothetical protein
MNSALTRTLCRLLIVLVAWMPFHYAHAGLIGTEAIVASSAAAERSAVLGFVSRADVANQLQSFGVDPATAQGRVSAMTDEEVRHLARNIEAAPAGGQLLLILVIALLVWWAVRR